MAQTFHRPALVEPRAVQSLEMVRNVTGGFDVDAWHVMDQRDNQLIADEILHGAGSSTFVYQFELAGKEVTGVSVIGARHLAAHYRGLKHRLVASMQKTGELMVFQSFPGESTPMAVSAQVIPELGDQPDFYAAVVEVVDIKTGNSTQVERREARFERRRDGSPFERPNYQTIAQSKAYRNAILALIPQDVIIRWKAEMLRLRKSDTITSSVLDEKRSGVLRFAAQHAVALDRRAIEHLTLDQIGGLGDAARAGQLPAFVNAAHALGLEVDIGGKGEGETERPEPAQSPPRRGRPPGRPPRAAPVERTEDATSTADSPGPSDTGDDEQQQQQPRPPRQVDFEV